MRHAATTVDGAMPAALFYAAHVQHGRAVLSWSGYDEPHLWLCVVGEQLVAVDNIGPDEPGDADYGFLLVLDPETLVADVQARYRQHQAWVARCRRAWRASGGLRTGRRRPAA